MNLQEKCFEAILQYLFFQQNKNELYNKKDLYYMISITDFETIIEKIINNENFTIQKIQKRIEDFKLIDSEVNLQDNTLSKKQDYLTEDGDDAGEDENGGKIFRLLFDVFILLFSINVENLQLQERSITFPIEKFLWSNYKENKKYISMFFEASMKCKKNNFWLSGEDFSLDLIRHKFFVESIEYYLKKPE